MSVKAVEQRVQYSSILQYNNMTALNNVDLQINDSSTSKFKTKKKQINNLFTFTVLASSRFDVLSPFRLKEKEQLLI